MGRGSDVILGGGVGVGAGARISVIAGAGGCSAGFGACVGAATGVEGDGARLDAIGRFIGGRDWGACGASDGWSDIRVLRE